MQWMLDPIWNFIQSQEKNAILGLCQSLMSLIAMGTSGFWDTAVVKAFLDFSKWTNIVVFAVALLFMLFDIAEEYASGKTVDFGVVFTNTIKTMVFVNFNALLAIMSMQLANIVTTSINFQVPTASDNVFVNIGNTYSSNINFELIILLVIFIACVVFFVMTVMRYGSMFVQILSSSLYIPNILRGDTTVMGEWLRQMVAIAGTYIMQYICFYCGLYYLIQANIIVCAIFWAGMMSVSKVLQKFGYSTGTKGMFSSAASYASQGIQLLSKV